MENSVSLDDISELLFTNKTNKGDDGAGEGGVVVNGVGVRTIRHPLDNSEDSRKSSFVSVESLEVDELPEEAPTAGDSGTANLSEAEDELQDEDLQELEDLSMYQAVLSPDCQDVRLTKEDAKPRLLTNRVGGGAVGGKKVLRVEPESVEEGEVSSLSEEDGGSLSEDVEDGGLADLSPEDRTEEEPLPGGRPHVQVATIAGVARHIDLRVIEPFRRVLSHGGYLGAGCEQPIIVFSACFLPARSRVDYAYVTNHLFYYVHHTLEQLVTDDYVLVYLHATADKRTIPRFSWLRRSYQLVDRRLRKSLSRLYLVHPTFWLKTLLLMARPFISHKFARKVVYVHTLAQLQELLPLHHEAIPEPVRQYDRLKQSVLHK